jgi:hypothetical protein
MRAPHIPRSGQYLHASWGRELIQWINSLIPVGDRKTIRTRRTSSGTSISAILLDEDKEPTGYACKITGSPMGGVYPVDVYDEKDGERLGSGYAQPMMLHISEVVPVGEWIAAPTAQTSYIPASEDS